MPSITNVSFDHSQGDLIPWDNRKYDSTDWLIPYAQEYDLFRTLNTSGLVSFAELNFTIKDYNITTASNGHSIEIYQGSNLLWYSSETFSTDGDK